MFGVGAEISAQIMESEAYVLARRARAERSGTGFADGGRAHGGARWRRGGGGHTGRGGESRFDYLDAPVQRVTGADIPMPYAKNLEDLSLPKPQQIATVVKRLLGRA